MMTGKKPPTKEIKLYLDKNLQLIFGITLMAVLGVASITPAFPKVIKAFQISAASIGLLITVFTLPGVLLTPLLGVLADRWGRKKVLIPSLFLFAIAGAACALARDFQILLILRFIQGIGAASIGSLNVTIIGDLYSGKERAAAMGYNASILSIGTAAYPAIGGALAMFAWYYPFVLPLLAIPIGISVLLSLNNPEPKNKQNFADYFRAVLKSINAKVFGLYCTSMLTFIILYGAYLTYYPILISKKFAGTPLVIGLVMSFMSLTTAATSSQLGKWVRHISEKKLIRFSFFIYGLSLFLIPFVQNLYLLLLPTLLFGIAHGINIPTIQTLLASMAPLEHRAAFMSLNGMVLRLGQTVGPLLIGLFFTLWGLSGAFFSGAIVALIAVGMAVLLIR